MEAQAAAKLKEFIQASKSSGAADESLVALLTRKGWPAEEVYAALGDYWAGVTGVAVPVRGKSGESAREAFLYLLAFSTLCAWATALGSAMFSYIDHWFPDPVSATGVHVDMRTSVTSEMATLVVAFPIFLFVMRIIVQAAAAQPDQLQSGVRRWLTYIALLGAAGTVIGDLIWFFDYLLSGGITIRFFLKSAVVMIISAAIFLYYLRSLRPGATDADPRWNRLWASVSTIAVAAVFIIGVTVAGTPSQIRSYQADTKRWQAVRELSHAIRAREMSLRNQGQPGELPSTLNQLVLESRVTDARTKDPETQKEYEYHPLSGTRYELCAIFSHPGEGDAEVPQPAFWRHGSGQTCFALDAARDLPY